MKRFLPILLLLTACTAPQRDLTLHYDRPATYFEEALPVGNGRLGAMVYGNPVHERLSLNDITLWTGEPDKGPEHPDLVAVGLTGDGAEALKAVREALDREDYAAAEQLQRGLQGHFSESYMPLGNLRIDYDSCAVTAYERTLDLSRAVATTSYLRDGALPAGRRPIPERGVRIGPGFGHRRAYRIGKAAQRARFTGHPVAA